MTEEAGRPPSTPASTGSGVTVTTAVAPYADLRTDPDAWGCAAPIAFFSAFGAAFWLWDSVSKFVIWAVFVAVFALLFFATDFVLSARWLLYEDRLVKRRLRIPTMSTEIVALRSACDIAACHAIRRGKEGRVVLFEIDDGRSFALPVSPFAMQVAARAGLVVRHDPRPAYVAPDTNE